MFKHASLLLAGVAMVFFFYDARLSYTDEYWSSRCRGIFTALTMHHAWEIRNRTNPTKQHHTSLFIPRGERQDEQTKHDYEKLHTTVLVVHPSQPENIQRFYQIFLHFETFVCFLSVHCVWRVLATTGAWHH